MQIQTTIKMHLNDNERTTILAGLPRIIHGVKNDLGYATLAKGNLSDEVMTFIVNSMIAEIRSTYSVHMDAQKHTLMLCAMNLFSDELNAKLTKVNSESANAKSIQKQTESVNAIISELYRITEHFAATPMEY